MPTNMTRIETTWMTSIYIYIYIYSMMSSQRYWEIHPQQQQQESSRGK